MDSSSKSHWVLLLTGSRAITELPQQAVHDLATIKLQAIVSHAILGPYGVEVIVGDDVGADSLWFNLAKDLGLEPSVYGISPRPRNGVIAPRYTQVHYPPYPSAYLARDAVMVHEANRYAETLRDALHATANVRLQCLGLAYGPSTGTLSTAKMFSLSTMGDPFAQTEVFVLDDEARVKNVLNKQSMIKMGWPKK